MKPREPLTAAEKAQITTLTADGWSPTRIARHIGRSRHAVRNALANPETQRAVKDEKAELAEMYKKQARAIVASIDQETIEKANLLQRMTSAGIATDKALTLTGDTPPIRVELLVQAVEVMRHQRAEDNAHRLALPAPTGKK